MDYLMIIPISLLLFWFYKCIGVVDEGWHKNIVRLNRYHRTISGSSNRKADKNGKLSTLPNNAKNKAKLFWIWYGIDKVKYRQFQWAEPRSADSISDSENIIWGEDDAIVSYYRNERTNRHKDQHDYRFVIKNLETGEKKDADPDKDAPENIKINSLINAVVRMENLYDAEFRDGGDGGWWNSMLATLTGTLGEVISSTTYADLPKARGENIRNILVKNVEPEILPIPKPGEQVPTFYFKDAQGNRRSEITFIERVNYEMLEMKKYGVSLVNISLLDYETTDNSKEYQNALQELAVAKVRNLAADETSSALRKELEPKKEFLKEVLKNKADQEIRVKGTEDVTAVKKAQAQPQLRVIVEGSNSQSSSLDVNKLIDTTIGLELAQEIRDEGNNSSNQKTKNSKK